MSLSHCKFFCLKESLRLYPPAGPTFREVAEDNYDICGYSIPKGTTVAVSTRDFYWWLIELPYWFKADFLPKMF